MGSKHNMRETDFQIRFCFLLSTIFYSCMGYRPCVVLPDSLYNGKLLNCSHTGISSHDIAGLDVTNVSSLILNNNDIRIIRNNSFIQCPQLRRLECVACNLRTLEADALSGLVHLDALLLQRNTLQMKHGAFPPGFFGHAPRLKVLNIGTNENDDDASSYSDFVDLFDTLPELTQLEIDSFRNLRIGSEFAKLKNLHSLNITCRHMLTLSNESLQGFNTSSVKHFSLLNGYGTVYENEDCDMLFHNLPNISSLIVVDTTFGNRKLMKMLIPLQYKHLDLLYLDRVGLGNTWQSKEDRVYDRMISADMVQYLKHVCVSHFVWLHSFALSIDLDDWTLHEWRFCLKSMTLVTGGAPITVDATYLYQIFRLKKLEQFVFMLDLKDKAVEFWKQNNGHHTSVDAMNKDGQDFGVTKHITKSIDVGSHQNNSNVVASKTFRNLNNSIERKSHNIKTKHLHFQDRIGFPTTGIPLYQHSGRRIVIVYSLPHFLTDLVLDAVRSFRNGADVWYKGKNSLQSLALRNTQHHAILKGRILGLNHLQTIDLTGSKTEGNPTFFRWFPSLINVIMRNTLDNSDFFAGVAESVPMLEYFDIADNGLRFLPKNMFHSNKRLKYLCLASNRFARIPFPLTLTPQLEILDLRENSLVMTLEDRQTIDDLVNDGTDSVNFSILLDQNELSCACTAMPFLKWLHNSQIHFDKGRDYVCMTGEGGLAHTSEFTNVRAFWRQCSGQRYFLVSLILSSTLAALYLATLLTIMHKTRILSRAMQIVMPGFRLKTRKDFSWDVVIGYADQDAHFIRYALLPYLEDKWRLRTFVHQRDLLHDPLLMSNAIRDSWRSLLVITEHFLDHCHMAHNVMKVCAFFVTTSNPRSVVVMVEERMTARIPDYVLQVVDEDNIIVLPALSPAALDYEAKETLKTRILT